jgi:hypothetical protein
MAWTGYLERIAEARPYTAKQAKRKLVAIRRKLLLLRSQMTELQGEEEKWLRIVATKDMLDEN